MEKQGSPRNVLLQGQLVAEIFQNFDIFGREAVGSWHHTVLGDVHQSHTILRQAQAFICVGPLAIHQLIDQIGEGVVALGDLGGNDTGRIRDVAATMFGSFVRPTKKV